MDGITMSNSFWIRQLKRNLSLLAKTRKSEAADLQRSQILKIAYVGVGSELNGDDAAGLWVIRELRPIIKDSPHVLCLESGVTPENAIGPLRKFKPDGVILADAADFGAVAGTIRLIDEAEVGGFSFSTHSFPLGLICSYLTQELNCPVWILTIQPLNLEFDQPLTPPVREAIKTVAVKLTEIL